MSNPTIGCHNLLKCSVAIFITYSVCCYCR